MSHLPPLEKAVKPILEQLAEYDGERGRVVSFELSHDKKAITVAEECDGYFRAVLDKSEFGQMIAELQALHAQMDDL